MRRGVWVVVLGMAVLVIGSQAGAQDMKDPKAILKKAKETFMALDSYSFICIAEGWEKNVSDYKAKNQAMAGEVAGMAPNLAGEAQNAAKEVQGATSAKEQYMKFSIDIRFKKPYLIRMRVIQSDYVPQIMYNSILNFRSDKDTKNFTVTIERLGIPVKRGINTESGNLFTSNWIMSYVEPDFYATLTQPVFDGVKEISLAGGKEKKKAYAISFTMKNNIKIGSFKADFKGYGVPDYLLSRFNDDMKNFEKDNVGKIVFYYDVSTFLLIRKEAFQRGSNKLFWTKDYVNIKTNYLEPDVHFKAK